MADYQKTLTELDLRDAVERGELRFPPFELVSFDAATRRRQNGRSIELDGLLTLRWRERSYELGVEFRRLSTPKSIDVAVQEVRRKGLAFGVLPLVVVPYLSRERLATLEAEGVSGLDLCGNGVVVVPGELLVYRTGNPNRFPAEGSIKNVYRRNSSIVARTFLLVPHFDSSRDLLAEIRRRSGAVTAATVSKVCAGLDEDLVIERSRDESKREKQLRLLQPEKLLDLLAANYAHPTVGRSFTGKCTLAEANLLRALKGWAERTENRVTMTGASSVEAYAVMAREPVRTFYCTDLEGALGALGETVRETDRFTNVSFLETTDELVYFDSRDNLVASPIQAYLELSTGDKRERETAEQVRRAILLRPLRAEKAR